MQPEHARELLARERTRIERTLAGLGPEGGDADTSESSDAAAELVGVELDEGLAEQLREELGAIERAEQRLAEGTYGISVVSGEPIPDARLEAIPWADRTAEEHGRLGG
jgi:DnaK suppressor protein